MPSPSTPTSPNSGFAFNPIIEDQGRTSYAKHSRSATQGPAGLTRRLPQGTFPDFYRSEFTGLMLDPGKGDEFDKAAASK